MKNALVVGVCLQVTTLACAGDRVGLWPGEMIPDFQLQQIAATTQEVKAPGFKAAEHAMPYLDRHEAPARKNGGCMLLISGGFSTRLKPGWKTPWLVP